MADQTITLTAMLTVSIPDGAFDPLGTPGACGAGQGVDNIRANLVDAMRDRQWLDSRELETVLGLDYPALAHPDVLRYTLQVRPARPGLAQLFILRSTR